MTKRAASKPAKAKNVAAPPRQSGALAKPDETIAAELVRDLSEMIEAAQKQVATVANVALIAPHFHIGHRVRTRVLASRRVEYGGSIVSTASRQLTWSHRRGLA